MARRGHIPALTGLRFFAALWVVFHHTQYLGLAVYGGLLAQVAGTGRVGVDVFFVLSGFVLAYNYRDWFATDLRRRWEFLWIRVARVAPLAWLGLLAMTVLVLLHLVAPPRLPLAIVGSSWLANLLLVQSIAPVDGLALWDAPAWSVSVEMVCYFFFPALAFGVLRRVSSRRLAVVAIIACWGLGLVPIILTARWLPDIGPVIYFSPLARGWEFAAGAVLGALRCDRPSARIADRWIVLPIAGLLAVSFRPASGPLANYYWYLWAFPASIALVLFLGFGHSRVATMLSASWVVHLGDASYALYLLHWPALSVLAFKLGRPAPWWLLTLAIVVLLSISLVVYHCFEVPARRWLRAHPPGLHEHLASSSPRNSGGVPTPAHAAQEPQHSVELPGYGR